MHPFDGFAITAATFVLTIPIVAIIGGITYSIFAMRQKARLQELAYRERIARIERGLSPPPEVDPGAFERYLDDSPPPSKERARSVSAGIMMIGVGLGLYVMLAAFGEPDVGFGVGGFLAIIGGAMLASALVVGRVAGQPTRPPNGPAAQPPRADTNPPPPGV